ncbi:MDR family MFS transporter [Symbioplanes lichenis]|uniref:MDR family MFS transporter n=1 Tax=Symbioplanes lichenis TaxID=1629072 RepID=UPI002739E84D|nr:MDR family MFS transporter [Actinoplanes lichenis]
MPDPQRPADDAGLTHRQILVVLCGLLMGVALSALDQTIVATSIRTIADHFHHFELLAWVTTAYLATSTIVTPLFGKLSDLYGRKPCYVAAVSIFAVGSLACACATSIYQLAVFRGVQGIGAGGLFSLAFTILGDIVAPRQRARYQGWFLAVFTGANLLGPLVGGILAGAPSILGITGWRWVFLINVPLSVATLAVVVRVLTFDRVRAGGVRVDWAGGVLLVAGVAPLLIVAELGRAWGWGSAASLGCFAVFAVSTAAYVWSGKIAGERAFLPLRVFANRSFVKGTLVAFVVGTVMVGVISIIPQFFQVSHGMGPMEAGFRLLPTMLGAIVGALCSGQLIVRTGRYRGQAVTGGVLTVASLAGLYFLTGDASWPFELVALVLGFGVGMFNQPLTLAVQNVLPARDMGVSTGAVTFFRQLGGTLGLAFFLTLFFVCTPAAVERRVAAVSGEADFRAAVVQVAATSADPDARTVAVALRERDTAAATDVVVHDSDVLQALPAVVRRPFERAFADAMGIVFLAAAAVALAGLLLLLSWPPVPLRGESGLQEAARQ